MNSYSYISLNKNIQYKKDIICEIKNNVFGGSKRVEFSYAMKVKLLSA